MNIDITRLMANRPPKHYNNCKVSDMDPLSKGTIPREIEVILPDADGSKVLAMWYGFPSLAVNDYTRLRRDTTDTNVFIIEGTGGDTSGEIDHGSLAGLGDDDHTQYLNETRHAALNANVHSSGAATDGYVLTADGAGGADWEVGGSGPLNKYDATAAPTVNDDSGDGYSVGSHWLDVIHSELYVCFDATVGAAVWVNVSYVPSSGAWSLVGNPLWIDADSDSYLVANSDDDFSLGTNGNDRLNITDSGIALASGARVNKIATDTSDNDDTTLVTAQGINEAIAAVGGNGFSATMSGDQSIANNTNTKVQFDTEDYDALGDYDNTTNYRYTPSIAGKYIVACGGGFLSLADQARAIAYIYKNGALYKRDERQSAGGTARQTPKLATYVDMNGSTDYLEVYVYHNHGSAQNLIAGVDSYFQAWRIL